eukprot:RCo042548
MLPGTALPRPCNLTECCATAIAVGCYCDSSSRALPYYGPNSGVTPGLCATLCFSAGYLYAGVQDGTQCFCGNGYGRYGKCSASKCTKRCTADSTQLCGGSWANYVYYVGGTRPMGCFGGEAALNG